MKNIHLTEDEAFDLRVVLLSWITNNIRCRRNATIRADLRRNLALLRKIRRA